MNNHIIFLKNFLFLLLFLFLYGCNKNNEKNELYESIECPKVLFSTYHRNFLFSNAEKINLENLSFKASLNNYSFNNNCAKKNNLFLLPLDLLIVVEPMLANQSQVILPIYVSALGEEDKEIDTQFFSIVGDLNFNKDTNTYLESDIIDTLDVVFSSEEKVYTLVVGFMIDKEKMNLLN